MLKFARNLLALSKCGHFSTEMELIINYTLHYCLQQALLLRRPSSLPNRS